MLCISTMLRTPIAGRNNFFIFQLVRVKYKKTSFFCKNKWFWPANCVRSTRLLVKIHNKHTWINMDPESSPFKIWCQNWIFFSAQNGPPSQVNLFQSVNEWLLINGIPSQETCFFSFLFLEPKTYYTTSFSGREQKIYLRGKSAKSTYSP